MRSAFPLLLALLLAANVAIGYRRRWLAIWALPAVSLALGIAGEVAGATNEDTDGLLLVLCCLYALLTLAFGLAGWAAAAVFGRRGRA